MKFIILWTFVLFSLTSMAETSSDIVKEVFEKYQSGQYEQVIVVLDKLQARLQNKNSDKGKELPGFIC